MMKTLTILMLLFSLTTFGQTESKEITDKAFRFYMDGQFDSAAVYYERIITVEKKEKPTYYLAQLGDCYTSLENFEKAKKTYLQCLDDTTKMPFLSPQRECAHGLADLYYRENNYGKALEYLKLAEINYPYNGICSSGEFERKTWLNYKFSQCFKELNQLDSAISYLTPFMFSKTENLLIDSLEYLKITDYFHSLLRKKYTDSEIKLQLTSAIDNIYYKKELDTQWNNNTSDNKYYSVLCYFTFFGKQVFLKHGGYEANSWGGEPVKQYTKEYLIEQLSHTPTYKMIKE